MYATCVPTYPQPAGAADVQKHELELLCDRLLSQILQPQVVDSFNEMDKNPWMDEPDFCRFKELPWNHNKVDPDHFGIWEKCFASECRKNRDEKRGKSCWDFFYPFLGHLIGFNAFSASAIAYLFRNMGIYEVNFILKDIQL
jgi:hypothetical protein